MHLVVAVELPPQTWTLAVARLLVGGLLDLAAASAAVRDDLAVAVTEACSNVVIHAVDGGPYRLTVNVDDDRCVIEVQDAGPGFDPNQPQSTGNRPQSRSDGRDGGRGLLLIRALVDDLRLERRRPGMIVIMMKDVRPHLDVETIPADDGSSPIPPVGTVTSD
jgi:serine/threonine-protein kinase RsbW